MKVMRCQLLEVFLESTVHESHLQSYRADDCGGELLTSRSSDLTLNRCEDRSWATVMGECMKQFRNDELAEAFRKWLEEARAPQLLRRELQLQRR